MKDPFSILVAGVGGQGNLVCGRIIAEATIMQGLRPVVGDTFGASRRGGSVLTHIRIGKQDWGPLIPHGMADVLLGFEPLEALRAATKYAGENTIAVVSKRPVIPSSVASGDQQYPKIDDIESELKELCKQVLLLDTEPVLMRLDSTRVLNSFMLGVLSTLDSIPLDPENLREAVSNILGSEKNLNIFDEGANALS
ncbi:MAG: indolepyruvate oxidoreductase subunit beta [Candidatus Thorarchaeota archaeon]